MKGILSPDFSQQCNRPKQALVLEVKMLKICKQTSLLII